MKTVRTLPIVQETRGPVSLRALAGSHSFTPPVSVVQLLKRLSVKTFQASVTTPDPEALGGYVDLTIRGDGTYELRVHMHDSGFPDYSFRLGVFLRSTSGIVFALYSRGTVHGTLSPGSRDFDDTQSGFTQVLNDRWDEFAAGQLEVHREYTNELVEWLASTVLDKATFLIGAVTIGAPASLVIWGASSLGELTGVFTPGELGLAGLIAAEGQYFLFGPTYFIPVFIAGALVAAALFRRRGLNDVEIEEAKKVFLDTIPYEKIVISNLEGIGGRPFAIPNIDGQVIMGVGTGMFEPMRADTDNTTKRVFIHEMTHAWQYFHQRTITDLCRIIGTRTAEALEGQDAVYNYASPPDRDWSFYNMEQQAHIVADWYSVRFNGSVRQGASAQADQENDRYIRESIRLGRS